MRNDIRLAAYFTSGASDELVDSVRAAEDAGYQQAWFNDAPALWEDCYVHMSRTLDRTQTIRIGTGVTNPVTRHYTVSAGAHATLGGLHPGRVVLGIGRGDAAVHTLGLRPMSTAEFREVAPRLRAYLHGERIDVAEGNTAQLRWLKPPYVPLMIAASGPQNLQLAGAVADIVQIQVGVAPASIRWALDHVHRGAERAGRDPADVEISLLCAMWVADDIDEARDRCRWSATTAVNHIEAMMKTKSGSTLPEEMTNLVEARRRHGVSHNYDAHLEAAPEETSYLTPELIDGFAVAGDGDSCRAKIAEIAASGVHELASGFYNGEAEQLQRVGKEVIGPMRREAIR